MKIQARALLAKLLRPFSRPRPPGPSEDVAGTINRALQDAGLLAPDASVSAHDAPVDRAHEQPAPAEGPPRGVPEQGSYDAPLADDFSTHTLATASGERTYKLFTPPAPIAGLRPLLVMLHGCTQDPDDFAIGTRMNALARERGVFVLYPMQRAYDNPSRCWNWFRPGDQYRDAGEPAAIAAITREVMHTRAIDPDRIYVAGLSAGAAMAGIVVREFPELYAAVGIHSGLPAGAASDVVSALFAMRSGSAARHAREEARSPAPLIVFHGDRDTTVHPRNADRVVASHRVGDVSVVAKGEEGRPYTLTTYAGGNGNAPVEQWTVHGAGHAWSGGDASGSHSDPLGPDASREMLRFFLAHPKVAA